MHLRPGLGCDTNAGREEVEVDWTVAGCKPREVSHQKHNLEGVDCLLMPPKLVLRL